MAASSLPDRSLEAARFSPGSPPGPRARPQAREQGKRVLDGV